MLFPQEGRVSYSLSSSVACLPDCVWYFHVLQKPTSAPVSRWLFPSEHQQGVDRSLNGLPQVLCRWMQMPRLALIQSRMFNHHINWFSSLLFFLSNKVFIAFRSQQDKLILKLLYVLIIWYFDLNGKVYLLQNTMFKISLWIQVKKKIPRLDEKKFKPIFRLFCFCFRLFDFAQNRELKKPTISHEWVKG